MSDGKTHERINLIFIAALTYAGLSTLFITLYGSKGIGYALLLGIGYWAGTFYLNPDLDIKSRPYNRWKWLRFIWIPYQRLGHRSIWTHGIIIGDVIRLAYLGLIVISLLWGLSFLVQGSVTPLLHSIWNCMITYPMPFTLFFLGLCLSSFAHIIADHTSTATKRFFRRRR